jgi:hypothetical protein
MSFVIAVAQTIAFVVSLYANEVYEPIPAKLFVRKTGMRSQPQPPCKINHLPPPTAQNP